ncbi:MAG: ferredoxin [Lachnospiraceae bacterium]
MKTFVNEDCIGCGLCVNLCPEVFEFNDDGLSEATVDVVPENLEDQVKQATDECPVAAIETE